MKKTLLVAISFQLLNLASLTPLLPVPSSFGAGSGSNLNLNFTARAEAAESKEAVLHRISTQLESSAERPSEASLKQLEEELTRLLNLSSTASAYHLRATVRFFLNDIGGSLSDCSEAIKIDPKYSKAYLQRAICYCVNGKQEVAVSDFTKAIEYGDKSAGTFINRGSAEQQINKHTEAIADFTKAITLDHSEVNNSMTRMLRARSYNSAKQYELAIKDADFVIQADTSGLPAESQAEVYKTKGTALYFLQKYAQAIEALKRSADLSSGDTKGSTTFLIAASYAKLGDKEKALETLKISKKLGYIPKELPPDRPVHLSSSKADEMLKPYVEKARSTLPQAKARFLQGLPAGCSLSVTTRIHDDSGRMEQVFVLVKGWRGDTVDGELQSEVKVSDYKLGQPMFVSERDMLDWTIISPEGNEEGNLIGKFLDSQH